jgi:hypothetical protein
MNTREFVKLKADSSYVPIKYAVIEVYGSGQVWLKVIGYGIDTETNFNDYVESIKMATYSPTIPVAGLQGTMGEYLETTISAIEEYNGKGNHEGPVLIG